MAHERLTIEVVSEPDGRWTAYLYDSADQLAAQVAGESREAVLQDIADELGGCYAAFS